MVHLQRPFTVDFIQSQTHSKYRQHSANYRQQRTTAKETEAKEKQFAEQHKALREREQNYLNCPQV